MYDIIDFLSRTKIVNYLLPSNHNHTHYYCAEKLCISKLKTIEDSFRSKLNISPMSLSNTYFINTFNIGRLSDMFLLTRGQSRNCNATRSFEYLCRKIDTMMLL